MRIPLQDSFRGHPASEALEVACHREAAKLEKFAERITSCRVVISVPQHHHVQGTGHDIRIEVSLPTEILAVTRAATKGQGGERPDSAVRAAFDAMRRRIEDAVRKQRGDVKRHETPPRGKIVRLHVGEHYGFIESAEGDEIYFHANSLLNADFKSLKIGEQVRFAEEHGLNGPQASSVTLVGSHHHLAP